MKQKLANLENKIIALGEKQNMLHKLQAENSKYADQVSYQTNIMNSMKNKLDKHDAEIALVINNSNGQEDAIDNLKISLENIKLQITEHYTEMEQIDDMLQLLSKDQDGHVVETLTGYGLPANMDTWKNLMVVPELAARVTLLDPNNQVVAHLGSDVDAKEGEKADRKNPKTWKDGRFVHPHDACFDQDGNIFVAEWVGTGRVTKLERLS